jgi:catechol 2,3-dioxygenase-like lactoylglutathione lyase family enzyme
MQILGLVFAGTATDRREEMTRFLTDVLGLAAAHVEGAGADMFELPDGSTFAVSGPRELGETSRTLGFLVADIDEAVAGLRAAGVEVDDPVGNARFRYAHFHAPDGHLYELVERSD